MQTDGVALNSTLGRSLRALSPGSRTRYWRLVFLRTVANFLDIFGVLGLGLVVSVASGESAFSEFLESRGIVVLADSKASGLVVLSLLSLAFFLFKALASFLVQRNLFRMLAKEETLLAVSISRYIFSGGKERVSGLSTSQIQWATVNSPQIAIASILRSLSQIVADTSYLVALLLVLLIVDPLSTIALVLYFAAAIAVLQRLSRDWIARTGELAAAANQRAVGGIINLNGIYPEASVHTRLGDFVENFRESRSSFALLNARLNLLSAVPRYLLESFMIVALTVFVLYKFLAGPEGESLTTVAVFVVAGLRLVSALLPLQTASNDLGVYREQAAVALDWLDQVERQVGVEQSERKRPLDGTPTSAAAKETLGWDVSFRNVSYRYLGADGDILSNVSFEIEPGDHVAILGPSGAGKSTLAGLIVGLLKDFRGDIVVGGHPMPSGWGSPLGGIGYLAQKPGLFNGTVAQNITMQLHSSQHDSKRLREAIDQAELSDVLDKLPNGVNTELDLQLGGLSGGEAQRLGLARALYSQPKLLVLDEATSALDSRLESSVKRAIRNLGKGTTVILVSHRDSSVALMDYSILVAEGDARLVDEDS